jgi:hypothetical protein
MRVALVLAAIALSTLTSRTARAADPVAAASPFSAEAFEKHVARLRARLAELGLQRRFHILVESPFVVIGDEPRAHLEVRAASTVRGTVQRLKAQYFSRDPARILDIWLFRDASSYQRHSARLFGVKPETPFGFYSHQLGAMVMNIGTGGGTLVHELVHPFVEANFPGCPAWFNEGLGSLYEGSMVRKQRIVGLTNWRLPGLQRAIRRRAVPRFERMMATTDAEFYDRDPGTHYAQARYLLFYLQERGLLERFYREFHAARDADPTGVATLRSVLGEPDLVAFQGRWEAYVMRLKYR